MKTCDVCETAEVITGSKYVERKGKIGKVLVYACRNPECPNYGKEDEVFQEIKVTKED